MADVQAQAPTVKTETKAKPEGYLLKSGKYHYVDANGEKQVAKPGDRVKLTKGQLDTFGDLFDIPRE